MRRTVLHVGTSLIECSCIRSIIVGEAKTGGWRLSVVFHNAPHILMIDCEDEKTARDMLIEIGKVVQVCNADALCTDHFLIDCAAITHVVTVAPEETGLHILDVAFRGSATPLQLGCRDREDAILVLNMIKRHMTGEDYGVANAP